MKARLALAALMLVCGSPLFARADPARYMSAALIAETLHPAPGSTVLVGFRMSPQPGWHGYWSNPGDSGIAPTVRWSAPEGVKFGPLLHPAPTLLRAGEISSYVHEGDHVLLSRMTISPSFAAAAPIPVTAELRWAACTATQCVPLRATLKLLLTAGDGSKSTDWPMLQAAARKLPRDAPAGRFVVNDKAVRLLLPASLKLDPRKLRFYPDNGEPFDSAGARVERLNGSVSIAGPAIGAIPEAITGVVSDGRAAYRLEFVRAAGTQGQRTESEAATQPGPAKPRQKDARQETDGAHGEAVSSPDPPRSTDSSWLWVSVLAALAAAAGLILGPRLSRRR
jgi:DsbC/DsbD-like thiol-disulfide interchange protein